MGEQIACKVSPERGPTKPSFVNCPLRKWCGHINDLPTLKFQALYQSRTQTPHSYEEKRSGEQSRISLASARFCDIETQQCSKHSADNPLKKGQILDIGMTNFTVVRAVLRNNY